MVKVDANTIRKATEEYYKDQHRALKDKEEERKDIARLTEIFLKKGNEIKKYDGHNVRIMVEPNAMPIWNNSVNIHNKRMNKQKSCRVCEYKELLEKGFKEREAAKELGVSYGTIRKYSKELTQAECEKYGITKRTARGMRE